MKKQACIGLLAGILSISEIGCKPQDRPEDSAAPMFGSGRNAKMAVINQGYYPLICDFSHSEDATVNGGKFTGAHQFTYSKRARILGGEWLGEHAFRGAKDLIVYLPNANIKFLGLPYSGVVVAKHIGEIEADPLDGPKCKIYTVSFKYSPTNSQQANVTIGNAVKICKETDLLQRENETIEDVLKRLAQDYP